MRDDNQATTSFAFLPVDHIARMSDETDAKKILTASPMETWRRPPGRPRTMWIVDKDYPARLKSNNLSLNEAS